MAVILPALADVHCGIAGLGRPFVRENGVTRGENLIVEPGKEGKVVTEIVPGKLTIPARSVRLTPLAGDMTAAAAPSIFKGKDGTVEVLFGKETPSLWYLLEIVAMLPRRRTAVELARGTRLGRRGACQGFPRFVPKRGRSRRALAACAIARLRSAGGKLHSTHKERKPAFLFRQKLVGFNS